MLHFNRGCPKRAASFHMYTVYILYSTKCDRYYTGHTDNLDRRLEEHTLGRGGKYSSQCKPWELVYTERFPSRAEAMNREREIKRMKSRKYIEELIAAARAPR
jgi:putative endonuclease